MSTCACCRQPCKSSAEAVYCSQLLEAKEILEASRKKQLQRLKQQLDVPVAQSNRDALRKQVIAMLKCGGRVALHVHLFLGAGGWYLAVQPLNGSPSY